MNRPNKEDYWSNGLEYNEDDYKAHIESLERYCDKLENVLDKVCKYLGDAQFCQLDLSDYELIRSVMKKSEIDNNTH